MPKQHPASYTALTVSTKSSFEAPHSRGAWWFCKMTDRPLCVCLPTKQVEQQNCRNSSIYIPSSRLYLHSAFLQDYINCQDPELSRQHVSGSKQCLPFANTPDNLHNFECTLCACFRYIQLYHNADPCGVDLFSTCSDGSKGQP